MIHYIKSHKISKNVPFKSNLKYTYYWYHHMMPMGLKKYISDIIRSHNFYEFLWIKSVLEKESGLCYFPKHAYTTVDGVKLDDKELQIGINIMNLNNFNLITFEECECG